MTGAHPLATLTPQQKTDAWERLCDPSKGCRTACCYYRGSPCEHLRIIDHAANRGVCRIYPVRFGIHRTLAGQAFVCAPLHVAMRYHTVPPRCGYAAITSVNGHPVPDPTLESPSPWGVPVIAGQA